METRWRIVTAAGIATLSGAAAAQPVLQVDINALSATASAPFNQNFTGQLHVFHTPADPDVDGDAEILEVLIDGTSQNTGGAEPDEFSFEMFANFSGGMLTGGSLTVSVDANGSENTYTANILPSGSPSILHIGGGIFLLGGDTSGGNFTNPGGTFLGVDISPWGNFQPLPGAFTQIELNFGANLLDADTDVDVFVVPTPGSLVLLAIGGLAAMPVRRR